MEKSDKIIVGISIGDINGIGLEIILKTFEDKRMLDFCTPVLFGSTKVISIHKKILKLDNSIHPIHTLDKIVHDKINLMNVWKDDVRVEFGKTTPDGGIYALKSLTAATTALKENKVDVLLTAPINKENIHLYYTK